MSKDHTSSYSSLDSTTSNHQEVLKRLYVITGKGGVGKTLFALSLANYLQNTLHQKVLYNSFDQGKSPSILKALNLNEIKLSPESSLETYIAHKLKSRTIAKWIMKTPFFASLYQMIPGLGHMIMLGNIINKLKEDKELIIVLDSPSSGHAITMFESSHNFKEIFGGGLLFKDIEGMHDFMYSPNSIKTFIIGLPSYLAINESLEIINFLDTLKLNGHSFIMNNSFSTILKDEVANQNLPHFLLNKIIIEKELFKKYDDKIDFILPHEISNSLLETTILMGQHFKEIKL